MKESYFQSKIIKQLREMGCFVIKMQQNATTIKAIPDVLFLYGNKYGFIECKRKKPCPSDFQPGQEKKVEMFNKMSFARVAYPENWDKVLSEIKEFINGDQDR